VILHTIENPELYVGKRAHREGHALLRQARDEVGILFAAHAVINALDLEQIQCLGNVSWRAFFSSMCNGQKTFFPCPFEYRDKLGGRVTGLRGVQADSRNDIRMGKRLLEGVHGIVRTKMPQEAQN
jgi:hypothetical protein